jgi:predicted metalloenzyme YecM
MTSFQTQCKVYADILRDFLVEHAALRGSVDHIAYKCKDAQEFDGVIAEWLPNVAQCHYIILNNRRLASARFTVPIDLAGVGPVAWLEIMEPRPSKVGQDFVGVEHAEIVVEDLERIAALCDEKKIAYTRYSNPRHSAVVVSLSPQGHEIKFTDSSIADIVVDQHQAGESYTLK